MLPIGRWVLHESCRMAAVWRDLLDTAAPAVHVNVSGRQLEAGNLNADVRDALEKFQLSPSQLVLELTETHMPLIADSLRHDLMALRTFGGRVGIDDLGTGYSSLTRITELPVDVLEIDLSFVAGMDTDPTCAAVVHGILAIGSSLGLDVIAEGVETSAQARQLGEYGCTLGQGYLYSRPLAEPDLTAHLARNRRPEEPVVGIGGRDIDPGSQTMSTRSDCSIDTQIARTPISRSHPAMSPEARRSRSARHYVIDGPLTLRLGALLTLVSQSVGFPIVRINIFDEDTQHTIGLFGSGDRAAIARAEAFCDTVVQTGLPVLVNDAAADPVSPDCLL